MYATWPCPTADGGRAEEMVLGFGRDRERRLLIIPPLFDEANKFRHQIFEIMRRFDLRGIDCFCPDLPGCNESLAPHGAQTLESWRDAVAAAAKHFGATHLLAIRSGCWLAPEAVPGWLYAPAKPGLVLRNMLRGRVLASREAGRDESVESLMDTARQEGIAVSGWQLGAALVRELEAAEFSPGEAHTIVEQADVGGKALWLRAENDDDPEQADAIAALVAIGISGE